MTVGSTNILSAITDLQNNQSSALTNYYNKTESNDRYYTKSQVDTNIANVNIDTSNFVLRTGNVIIGDLITEGDVRGTDFSVSNEIHVDGNAVLNGILYLGGVDVMAAIGIGQYVMEEAAVEVQPLAAVAVTV